MSIQVWVPIVEAVLVALGTYVLIRKYADLKRTNKFSVGMTSLSWYLAFSMIFFIPLDIFVVSTHLSQLTKLYFLQTST